MTAKQEQLGELHERLASYFCRILDEEPTAAQIREARAFLADNGIQALPEASAPLRHLTDKMKFRDPMEDAG